MSFSMRRLMAVIKLKFKLVFSNLSVMTAPLLTIGMVVLYKVVYANLGSGKPGEAAYLAAMILNLGLLVNIAMGGVMLTCTPLAEEKEKNTLRSLMTSSISGLEYFIGSLVPPLVIMIVTNVVIVFLSGLKVTNFDWPVYLLLTTVASLTSCVLGMLIAMFSPNQMAANTYLMPFAFPLMIIPLFANVGISKGLTKVSGYLYTGVLSEMVDTFATGKAFSVTLTQGVVVFGELILIALLFTFFYKRNGYEKD